MNYNKPKNIFLKFQLKRQSHQISLTFYLEHCVACLAFPKKIKASFWFISEECRQAITNRIKRLKPTVSPLTNWGGIAPFLKSHFNSWSLKSFYCLVEGMRPIHTLHAIISYQPNSVPSFLPLFLHLNETSNKICFDFNGLAFLDKVLDFFYSM